MISFASILFPVDLSKHSRGAVSFVRSMANRFHSQVTALHVVEIPPSWYGPPELVAFEALVDKSEIFDDRRNALNMFLAETFPGVSVERCVQQGDPATIITRVAHQKHSSLIMMPTHGYGPFRSLLLGSVTAKVLHDAECPVWTAAHAGEMPVDPDQSWREILCAVSAEPQDVPLLRWALQFAKEQGAQLRLVHGVGGFEQQPEGMEDPLRDFLFGVAQERIAKLQTDAGTNLEVSIEAGTAGQVVREIALQRHADLLLVGRGAIQKPLGRLRSSAYAIVRDAPCPVISV
jgi:nucleotide-binding universal stress UspA family protein